MNYFLKKTKKEKGIYLQIYYSYYSNNVKKQKCYKTLGYEADLKKQGIEDPISYYSNEVIKLREHNSNIQAATITESSQLISYGPYIINALIDYLNCSTRYFDTKEYKSIITSYLFFNKIYDYNNNPKYDKNLSKSENALRFMNGLTSTFYDNFFKNDKYIFLYYTGDYYITLNKAGIPYKIYRSHDKFHLDGHKIVNIYDYESNIEKNEYISYLNNSDTYEIKYCNIYNHARYSADRKSIYKYRTGTIDNNIKSIKAKIKNGHYIITTDLDIEDKTICEVLDSARTFSSLFNEKNMAINYCIYALLKTITELVLDSKVSMENLKDYLKNAQYIKDSVGYYINLATLNNSFEIISSRLSSLIFNDRMIKDNTYNVFKKLYLTESEFNRIKKIKFHANDFK